MNLEQVRPEDSHKIRRFIRLPFELLVEEKNWVPPFSRDVRSLLTRRHPFFQHSDAAFFLVSDGGADLGRLAVFEHRPYNSHHNERTAFFSYFDAVDNIEAAGMLIDAAATWARRHGLQRLVGPKGFLRSDGQGLLVEGFEYFPAMGIPWNPSYYQRLLESSGCSKLTDLVSGYLDLNVPGDEKLHRVAEIARKRGAFEILSFTKKRDIRPWIPALKELQHRSFADNSNYVPSTDEEVEHMTRNMLFMADLSIMRFLTRGDDLAGFMFAYPNIGRAVQRSGGRLFPLGWLRLLIERTTSKRLDLNGIGIDPRFQKQGGDAILFAELERLIRSSRYSSAEVIQIDEKNFLSLSGIEHFGIHWLKRHRMFHMELRKEQ